MTPTIAKDILDLIELAYSQGEISNDKRLSMLKRLLSQVRRSVEQRPDLWVCPLHGRSIG